MGDTFDGASYDDSFIGDLVNFVASDQFQSMFEAYFLEHALEFDYDEEHKLKYYDLYQKFQDKFDKQLESFCEQQNMTQAEFMKRCRNASTDSRAKHYIDVLLSSVEYETFVKLMKIMRPVAEHRRNEKNKNDNHSDAKSEGKSSTGEGSPSKAAAKGNDDMKAEGKTSSDGDVDYHAGNADAKGSSNNADAKASSK